MYHLPKSFFLRQTPLNAIFHRGTRSQQATTKRKIFKPNRQVDPGIKLQYNVLNTEKDSKFEFEEFEDFEADFNDLNLTHREHERQTEDWLEKQKHLIVKRKSFKLKLPNFLTYSDKLQIRQLHNQNAEEWTVEKLAEGYPAIPEVIQKIVKSNWVKKSENKIKSHDEKVVENWELFKKGKLELPYNLVQHLKKFSGRKLNFDYGDWKDFIKPVEATPAVKGEFYNIIASYHDIVNKDKKCQEPDNLLESGQEVEKKPLEETYVTSARLGNRQLMTLNTYKENLKAQQESGKELDDEQIHMLIDLSEDDIKQVVQNSEQEPDYVNRNTIKKKYDLTTTNQSASKLFKYTYDHLKYPEYIKIPHGKRIKGCTYKLNDCYYDWDGTFLYRVPGMY